MLTHYLPQKAPVFAGAFFRPILKFFDHLVDYIRRLEQFLLMGPYLAGFTNGLNWHQI